MSKGCLVSAILSSDMSVHMLVRTGALLLLAKWPLGPRALSKLALRFPETSLIIIRHLATTAMWPASIQSSHVGAVLFLEDPQL